MKKPILCQFNWHQILLLFLFLGCPTMHIIAQTISGKVTSSNGETLPGVNIVVKGTTKGTTTDKNGQFSLEARKSQTLIFSF